MALSSLARGRSPRIGFGARPAVLVVDFARAWTDPASGFSIPLETELASAASLLSAARTAASPVVYTTVGYVAGDLETVPMLRKTPRVAAMRQGSWLTEIDARVAPRPDDLVLTKRHASSFFGTPLAAYLTARSIDTLLIVGCITSGCVRASTVDAAQHGLNAIVIQEAVGDRSIEAHEASLQSIDDLYGDVVSLEAAIAYLDGRAR